MKNKLVVLIGSITILAILLISTLAACSSPASPGTGASNGGAKAATDDAPVVKWRFQTNSARASEYRARDSWITEKVREASGGKFDITPFYMGELLPVKDWFEGVRTGVIEMLSSSIAYQSGVMPETNIIQYLPSAMRSMADPYHLVWSEEWNFRAKIQKAYLDDFQVIYLLPSTGVSSQYGVNFAKPVSRLAEVKTMKVRSYGITAEWLKLLGSGMVFIPGEELYTALAMGTVEAATWTDWGHDYDMKLHEVAKWRWSGAGTRGIAASGRWVNLAAWNALPDSYKYMLSYYWELATAWGEINGVLYNDMSKEKMINEWGVKEVFFPKEDVDEWLALGLKLWPDLAKKNARSKEWILFISEWMKWRGYLPKDQKINLD